MASDIQQRMDALRRTTAGVVVAEWLKDRLDAKQKQFMGCTEDTFKVQKGRCLELDELIKYLEGNGK